VGFLTLSAFRRNRVLTGIFRMTSIPVLLAIVAIAIAWTLVESQQRNVYTQNQRAEVLGHVSLIRAKLEGNINSNIQLLRGLVATIATEPDMNQARFAALSANLLQEKSQILHIAGAPGLVVKLIYPMAGNAQALGLDYRRHDAQRGAALRARATGEMILAGPVDLVQGGRAFVARFPVFVSDGEERNSFWGIVSAVIDVERLYAESGLVGVDVPVELALSGLNATGGRGGQFLGSTELLGDNPVTANVMLPSGSWQISARPKGGWGQTPPDIWRLRLLMLAAGALIMVPTLLSARLIEERQRNIAQLRDREKQLEKLSRRLRLALDTSKVAVWEANVGNPAEYWDGRMNALYGFPDDGGPRDVTHWERRVHPDDIGRARGEFFQLLGSQRSYASQYRVVLDDGQIRHIRATGVAYKDVGEPERLVGVNWDVTADVTLQEELKHAKELAEARNAELEAAKARIEHNALHDSLTGLPNRRHLDELLTQHAERFAETGETAALLQIDLDRFKQINDTLGHMAGDAMLIHAADVLRTTTEHTDFIARIGGDEFVVVRTCPPNMRTITHQNLIRLAERITQHMQLPVTYQGHECRVGVSIGIATDMEVDADPTRLLVNADIALYRAKDQGRNGYQFFNAALQAEIITSKRVADELLTALDKGQFVAHYQPQFDAQTLDVIGVEALARWQHPTEGLLAPHAFMKIAEDLSVVAHIDRTILDHTLRDFQIWEDKGLDIPKVSVNVSARRLRDDELIKNLRKLNITPGTVAFELVESIFLDDNDELTIWNVDQIKELGIDIEIDDFGTGYASIVSLMKLKPKRLKIDRQFIAPVTHSAAQRQLVGSIIDIGRSLGIEVLAEGVETMEHARVLRELGCNALQGYAFARPLSSEDLMRFIRAETWREAYQQDTSRAASKRRLRA
jgi:diguanylate cyclase (GGDEF)-like protein